MHSGDVFVLRYGADGPEIIGITMWPPWHPKYKLVVILSLVIFRGRQLYSPHFPTVFQFMPMHMHICCTLSFCMNVDGYIIPQNTNEQETM